MTVYNRRGNGLLGGRMSPGPGHILALADVRDLCEEKPRRTKKVFSKEEEL